MAKANTSTKDNFVEHVVEEYKRYEGYHTDRFEDAKKAVDQWKNKPPRREHDWQNAVAVPLMVEGEQTITPRLFTALFPTDAPMDIQVEGDAPEEEGIRIKGMIQHHFRVADAQGECIPTLTQNTLIGTGYMEGGSWYVRKGYQTGLDGNKYWTTLEARPDCRWVSFFEMYPHPAKRRMDDGLPIIRRRFIDAEALKKLAKNSEFDSTKLAEALATDPPEGGDREYDENKEKSYEVLEYWGPWDEEIYRPGGEQSVRQAVPWWGMIINRKVKIRSIANPYNHQIPPYIKTILFVDPDSSWFGVGIGSIGKATQERTNKIVNQRLDNVDLVLNKQGCYNGNDPLINTKKLQVSKPGLWHKTSDPLTSLRWMDIPDVTSSSYKEEDLAKNDFREATGAVANLMPEVGSEHRTAMGIQLLQGAAGMRFRPVLRKLEIDLIQQLAMFFFSNLKQFMTEAQWIQITGKNGELEPVKITPEQLQAKVFFIPTGISETMNKETQVGQLLRFKEVTAQDPTVNRQEINKRIAELMGFKDVHKLLTPIKTPSGGLSPDEQLNIQQRLGEGADPSTIKREMFGEVPRGDFSPQEQGQP